MPKFRPCLQMLERRRLLAAGALDPTFGLGGATAIRVDAGFDIGSVNALEDGKLLVATSFSGWLRLFRLNPDGSTDISFGIEGRLDETFSSDAREVAVSPAGRIAIAGGAGEIVMLHPDGTRDTAFGGDGVVGLGELLDSLAGDVQIDFTNDERLIAAAPVQALSAPPDVDADIAVLRLNSDGTRDHSFGNSGIKTIPGERLDGVALTADGHVLLSTHRITTVLDDDIEEPLLHVQIHRLAPDGGNDEIAHIGGGLDNRSARVKDISSAPDGSVVALVYDLNASQDSYVYSLRRYSDLGAVETANHPLDVPPLWTALEADVADNGQTIVSGYDYQGHWFTQRYTVAGHLDPTYGELGVGRPNIEGPSEFATGDALVLGDGSVVIGNTRERNDGAIHDLVFVKLAGGEGTPPDVRLNARGSLIAYGTPGNDQISLYIRARDGRLIFRANDYVQSFAPSRVKRIAIFAGGGDDVAIVGTGVRGAYLQGDDGNDSLTGGDFSDILFGGAGDDSLTGGLAPDRMFGDDGNDLLFGNGGRDLLWGGGGNDVIFGNGHEDLLFGEDGDDLLYGGGDADVLFGGLGADAAAIDSFDTVSDDIESILT